MQYLSIKNKIQPGNTYKTDCGREFTIYKREDFRQAATDHMVKTYGKMSASLEQTIDWVLFRYKPVQFFGIDKNNIWDFMTYNEYGEAVDQQGHYSYLSIYSLNVGED